MLDKILLKSEPGEKPKGRFIVIDGPDATGKKTQVELLAKTLAASGYDGEIFDFPRYGAPGAYFVEKYLAGQYGDAPPRKASYFYALDRHDASENIRESLSAGRVVLANRFVTSNAGHQGAKIGDKTERIAFYKWLMNLEYGDLEIPQPDLTIVLRMPANIAYDLLEKRAAADNRKKDIHESNREHLEAAERAYREIAEVFPKTIEISCVDSAGRLLAPGEIHGRIWDKVLRMVLKNNITEAKI